MNLSAVERLSAFYADAERELQEVARRHGVVMPQGHALIEPGILHWRLSAYADSPEASWASIWSVNAQSLGLGLEIEPGDIVLDQEGRSWTLLGLDPSGNDFPVRLVDSMGQQYMASLQAAGMFQLLVKKEKQPQL